MSKKFFSLIHHEDVHIAPGVKFVPADAISKLVDADETLEHVKKDAEKYREEVIQECETLKQRAQLEGYEEGFSKWAEHLANIEAEIIKVRKDLEKTIIPVALKAAKKIVGREIELSPDVISDIVGNSLKAVATHRKVTIYVNRKDLDILEKKKNELKAMFENLESFKIQERNDIEPGGCIIETENGIINARLQNQWDSLEKAFESLMIKK